MMPSWGNVQKGISRNTLSPNSNDNQTGRGGQTPTLPLSWFTVLYFRSEFCTGCLWTVTLRKKMLCSDLSRNQEFFRLRSCTAARLTVTVTHQHLGNAGSASHSSKRAKSSSCSCHGWSRQDDSADMETGHNQSTFTSLLLHNWCCGVTRVFP